jgi:hypothetical protein
MPCDAIHALHYPGAAEPKKREKKGEKKGNEYSFALSLYKFIGIGIGIQQSSLSRAKKKNPLCYTKPQNDNHDHKKRKYGIRYENKHSTQTLSDFIAPLACLCAGAPRCSQTRPSNALSQASPSVL